MLHVMSPVFPVSVYRYLRRFRNDPPLKRDERRVPSLSEFWWGPQEQQMSSTHSSRSPSRKFDEENRVGIKLLSESSSIRTTDNSSVRATDNSSVRATDNSSLRATDNSSSVQEFQVSSDSTPKSVTGSRVGWLTYMIISLAR